MSEGNNDQVKAIFVWKTGSISILVVDQHGGIICKKKMYCQYPFCKNFKIFSYKYFLLF